MNFRLLRISIGNSNFYTQNQYKKKFLFSESLTALKSGLRRHEMSLNFTPGERQSGV